MFCIFINAKILKNPPKFQIKNDEKNSGEYVATAQIAKLGGGVFSQIHYLSLATSWRIVKCLYSLF